jgi:hypothetical protein
MSDSDLAFVGNMGSHSGDKLLVVHPLLVFGLLAIAVADLALFLREGETLQG